MAKRKRPTKNTKSAKVEKPVEAKPAEVVEEPTDIEEEEDTPQDDQKAEPVEKKKVWSPMVTATISKDTHIEGRSYSKGDQITITRFFYSTNVGKKLNVIEDEPGTGN